MEAEKRREELLRTLKKSDVPVSGSKLASLFGVSRQIIVSDIALLKASGEDILSTVRGYQCLTENECRKYIYVNHGRNEMEKELNTIVDNGGFIIDTKIEHPIYGKIRVDMDLTCRREVRLFIEKTKGKDFSPLSALTSGKHAHLIETQSVEDMRTIEDALERLGILQDFD